MAFVLPLKGEGDDKCLSILNAVEETIARQLRAGKSFVTQKKMSEDYEPLQPHPDLEEGYCKAVLSCLCFLNLPCISVHGKSPRKGFRDGTQAHCFWAVRVGKDL
jgi:hypothetical protein